MSTTKYQSVIDAVDDLTLDLIREEDDYRTDVESLQRQLETAQQELFSAIHRREQAQLLMAFLNDHDNADLVLSQYAHML